MTILNFYGSNTRMVELNYYLYTVTFIRCFVNEFSKTFTK